MKDFFLQWYREHGETSDVPEAAANAKLTDDEERAKNGSIATLGWPRSSSFG